MTAKQLMVSLVTFGSVILIPTVATPVLAQSASPSPTSNTRLQKHMATATTNADKEIDRRNTALQALITRINQMVVLASSEKTTLTTQVQNEISTLTSLKAKIDADTDPTALAADKKSIVDSYRVFLVYMPQIRITAMGDRITDLANKMNDLATKLQTRLSQNGKVVNAADAQTKLTDLTNQINTAKTQAQNAITAAASLTPSGYPGNKTDIQNDRTMLQAARKALTTARQDITAIRADLKPTK